MAPRRPRDIDAELRALQDKARQLRTKQKAQLGELLLATGAADALDPDTLAGLLLHGLEQAKSNPQAAESWRQRGEAFFRRERASTSGAGESKPASTSSRPAHRDAEDAARPAAE
ncbi:conjugal transfer protein TraD [Pseudoroseomonas ludipueritiae]|uniref:Conjugal transfer protein TraD n=1 Tax=Pseudoroseomonas ludipueritiae TaxID=198093 RepID=A0ABR7R3A4_9PROT|nr:conjugal transfer protein TraD [Pseudoroseomonas ludipueritiae]MBC9176132.1 conjugal transfer protein TraD [Pseudoroseomonas ludipueritiae]